MDDQVPHVGAKSLRRWIDAPEIPEEATLEELRARFRTMPRIVEAWLTGSRMTPTKGASRESTDIALVLDPPLDPKTEEMPAVLGSLPEWSRPASSAGGGRGWIFVSNTVIREEAEHCSRIYVRASP
jgi:hypothetical protein